MNNLNEMWQELEEHQPVADRLGYGQEWKHMCVERTVDACRTAARAAYDARYAAARAARASAWDAAWDAIHVAAAAYKAADTVKNLNQGEQK